MEKCVVICGADGGLGRALTANHLRRGDRVYALALEVSEKLEQFFRQYGKKLTLLKCDITYQSSVADAAEVICTKEERTDILYCAAGLYYFSEKVGIREMNMEKALEMYHVNALGPLRVVQALWDTLKEESVVAMISSEAGSISASRRTDDAGYCMSKAALNMGAKILSNALWEKGTRVICFHPGWMRTAMGGAKALESDQSVSPEESGRDIAEIAVHADRIPWDWRFMDHKGNLLSW